MQMIQITGLNGKSMAINIFGSGEPYLLLHGIPGSSQTWIKSAKILAEQGFKVIVPDLLGFGLSSKSDKIDELWVDAQADMLISAIEKMEIKTMHLAGHDYGGPIAITLYKRIPERINSLVLLSTNTFTDTPLPIPLSFIIIPYIGSLWSKFMFSKMSLKMMLKQGVGLPKIKIDEKSALGDGDQIKAIATIFSHALTELKSRYRSVEDMLCKIEIPTLVIWGTKDPFFSVSQGKRTADAIKNSKFVLLDNAGHFLPEERPEEVAKLLSESASKK